MKLVKVYWPIKPFILCSHQKPDKPKFPQKFLLFYHGMQSQLCPHLQAPNLPLRSQSKTFRSCGKLFSLLIFVVPCDWLLIIQKFQEVFFNMEFSRLSSPRFSLTTHLMSSFRVSIRNFFIWVRFFGYEIVEFVPPLWNPDGPEMPECVSSLGTPRYSYLYFLSSTYLIVFHQCVRR